MDKGQVALEVHLRNTADELRAHFIHLSLATKNVGFRPKPLDPNSPQNAPDPVLKEGKVLTNMLNRLARSCFYSAQKHSDGRVPVGEVSAEVLEQARTALLDFERCMHDRAFHKAFDAGEAFIRWASKRNWKAAPSTA